MSEHSKADLTRADTRSTVIGIVAGISRIDPEDFEEDALIREELGIDSLMAMEIVAACERALGISIDEGQVFCLETAGDFLDLVDALLESENREG
jgi:acyl carrier protein